MSRLNVLIAVAFLVCNMSAIGQQASGSATQARAGDVTEEQAREFFGRYAAFGNAFDVRVLDLYADSSRISFNRRYPPPLPSRTAEVSGAEWRSMGRAAMQSAKAKGDRSEYSNLRFEPMGSRMKIRADRYSVLKCYWDRGYYMIVGRDANGQIFIAEEHFDTQAGTSC